MTVEEAHKKESASAAAEDVVVDQAKSVSLAAFKATEAVAYFKGAFGAEEVERDASLMRKADQEAIPLLYVELKIGGASLIVANFAPDDACSVKTMGIEVFSLMKNDMKQQWKLVKIGESNI